MPGKNPCAVGCTCGHHPNGKLPADELRRRSRERAREAYLANRDQKIAYARTWNENHPERRRESTRKGTQKYREKNRSVINARARARRDPVVDSLRAREWKYGVSPERIAQLYAEQECLCYLCREPLDLTAKRGYAVDHDHTCCRGRKSCGKCIRGLACSACNRGIGSFGDDPERMRRVADHLEAANARLAAERAAQHVQEELPINVRRLERKEESA